MKHRVEDGLLVLTMEYGDLLLIRDRSCMWEVRSYAASTLFSGDVDVLMWPEFKFFPLHTQFTKDITRLGHICAAIEGTNIDFYDVEQILSSFGYGVTLYSARLLTPEVFDSPECPEWAQYAAVDADGWAVFHENKPAIVGTAWRSFGEGQTLGQTYCALGWENSLISRKVETPEYTMEDLVAKLGHNFKIKRGEN